MRAVNLLPRETHSRVKLRRVDPVLAGGVVATLVVVAAVGAGFVISHRHAASERQQLASARAELARLQAHRGSSGTPVTPVLLPTAATAQMGPWRVALQTALATRVPWDGVLADLARVVPANVTLTTVNLGGASGSSSTATGSPTSLALSGSAYSQQGVATLLSRLMLLRGLSQVALATSTTDPKTGIVTFTVNAQLAAAAPAAGAA